MSAEPIAIAPTSVSSGKKYYDAIIIGTGMGGLVVATQLAIWGARVLLLKKYIISGGSSGFYQKEGCTFDVGSFVMFGCRDKGLINLITRALADVGRKLDLILDPTTVHYHMPSGLPVRVHRDYEAFIYKLSSIFPHEAEGIRSHTHTQFLFITHTHQ